MKYRNVLIVFNPTEEELELAGTSGEMMNAFSALSKLIADFNSGGQEKQAEAMWLLDRLTGESLKSYVLTDILTEQIMPVFDPKILFTGNIKFRIAEQDFRVADRSYSTPF